MITVTIGGYTDRFDGPLDLLLALVRRNEYPLARLPIAEITRQYNAYLRSAQEADVELGADFIETASWLVLLKSRSILPQEASAEAPHEELERVLLDHQALRATTEMLRERLEQTGIAAAPPPLPPVLRALEAIGAPPTIQDVLIAARKALELARAHATGSGAPPEERYPVEEVLQRLTALLAGMKPMQPCSTAPWFAEQDDPEARVALLLALLELARLRQILLGQKHAFATIHLKATVAQAPSS